MISKSTWLHLRIPFSIFLLPVFMFALSQSENAEIVNVFLVFLILHVFIYPASNGFNSFYDKDEKSIGGLKNPPIVSRNLLGASLLFDFFGIALALLISAEFAAGVFIYGLISKAYSHPAIRLKKYPIAGLLTVGLFQGGFVYLICIQVFEQIPLADLSQFTYSFPALISTVLLIGSYPMTQIYQHEEDRKRGDISFSILLGIRGTFLFTGITFLLADILFGIYFHSKGELFNWYLLQVFLLPVLVYFNWWMLRSWKNPSEADFEKTMRLNMLSSVCMILFFGTLIFFGT